MATKCVYKNCDEQRVTAFVCSKHLFDNPKLRKKPLSADARHAEKPYDELKWRRMARLNHKGIIERHS